jgi:hypothetical protein
MVSVVLAPLLPHGPQHVPFYFKSSPDFAPILNERLERRHQPCEVAFNVTGYGRAGELTLLPHPNQPLKRPPEDTRQFRRQLAFKLPILATHECIAAR